MFLGTVAIVLKNGSIKRLSKLFSSESECNKWVKEKMSQAKRLNYNSVSGAYRCV